MSPSVLHLWQRWCPHLSCSQNSQSEADCMTGYPGKVGFQSKCSFSCAACRAEGADRENDEGNKRQVQQRVNDVNVLTICSRHHCRFLWDQTDRNTFLVRWCCCMLQSSEITSPWSCNMDWTWDTENTNIHHSEICCSAAFVWILEILNILITKILVFRSCLWCSAACLSDLLFRYEQDPHDIWYMSLSVVPNTFFLFWIFFLLYIFFIEINYFFHFIVFMISLKSFLCSTVIFVPSY